MEKTSLCIEASGPSSQQKKVDTDLSKILRDSGSIVTAFGRGVEGQRMEEEGLVITAPARGVDITMGTQVSEALEREMKRSTLIDVGNQKGRHAGGGAGHNIGHVPAMYLHHSKNRDGACRPFRVRCVTKAFGRVMHQQNYTC